MSDGIYPEMRAKASVGEGRIAPISIPEVKASIIDRRIEKYASQGLTRAAILEQLLGARWPWTNCEPGFRRWSRALFTIRQRRMRPSARYRLVQRFPVRPRTRCVE